MVISGPLGGAQPPMTRALEFQRRVSYLFSRLVVLLRRYVRSIASRRIGRPGQGKLRRT
jgi:hypothetical protein